MKNSNIEWTDPSKPYSGAIYSAEAVESLRKRIAALEAELAAAKKDAERYRWLRLWGARWGAHGLYVSDGMNPVYEQRLDAAIDAALAAQEKA